MKFIKWQILIILFLFESQTIFAQGLFPRLGEQRVGTSAMTFLKIGVGARAISMGGSFCAISDDASSLYWNPAGLVQIEGNEAIISHIQWPVDIQFDYAGYVHQVSNVFAIGASVGLLYTEDMEVTNEYHPNGTGEYFSFSDFVSAISFSVKMTDRFSFGTSVKFVQENLADLTMTGYMLDFGTFYRTGYKSLRIAASLRNFGSDVRPSGSYIKSTKTGSLVENNYSAFSPPTNFTFGAAMEVYETEINRATVSLQMNHPMDNAEISVIGGEYRYRKFLSLRSGYRFDYSESNWTFGAGAEIPLGKFNLKVDYAYADFGRLDISQQFSLFFNF